MEWVRRNYLLTLTSIAIAVFVGVLAFDEFSHVSSADQKQPVQSEVIDTERLTLSCFDTVTATIRVTTGEECESNLISLGNAALEQILDSDSVTSLVHPILLARFNAAYLVAKLAGVDLYITSAFRTLARQEQLFRSAVAKYGSEREAAKWVLPPLSSHHPQGLALDINYPGDRPGAKWLDENGARFGLCRVYANEWWHFEGVIAPGESCPPLAPNALVDLAPENLLPGNLG